MKPDKTSLHFLIVEDVKEHALLIKEAVHVHDFLHDISSVNNCSLALKTLKGYVADDYLPHVIILDLNVGGMDARKFLTKLSTEKELAQIPMFVFSSTGSDQDRDFVNTFKNCIYIVKPVGIIEFMNLINFICNFWSEHKKMPAYNSLQDRFKGGLMRK